MLPACRSSQAAIAIIASAGDKERTSGLHFIGVGGDGIRICEGLAIPQIGTWREAADANVVRCCSKTHTRLS